MPGNRRNIPPPPRSRGLRNPRPDEIEDFADSDIGRVVAKQGRMTFDPFGQRGGSAAMPTREEVAAIDAEQLMHVGTSGHHPDFDSGHNCPPSFYYSNPAEDVAVGNLEPQSRKRHAV